MSYQSVIKHQARSLYRVIRGDYVSLCAQAPSATCAAALLDLAEAWTNYKLDRIQDETLEEIEIDDELWFFRSEDKIQDDLFHTWGLNKIRQNRQWLLDKGYLECKQITRDNGGFINQYRLKIDKVQSDLDALPSVNIKVRNARKRPLKSKGASVNNNGKNIVREIKSKEKEIAAALPQGASSPSPKKERKPNPYYDAIALYLDVHGGRNGNLQAMLEGQSKRKGYLEYNLDPSMSCEEFSRWAKDWRQANPTLSLQSPEKIQSHILSWRLKQSAKPKTSYDVFGAKSHD